MSKWTFKSVTVVGPSKVGLVELTQEQQKRISAYEEALIVAESSQVPDPIFSNYYVKGSVGLPSTQMLPTGNIEYGICQALHCEETAVAVLRVAHGKNPHSNLVLGFCGQGESSDPPTCCGNCRDILLDAFGPELEIVTGKSDGGLALVSKLENLLCEKYDSLNFEGRYHEAFLNLVEATARHGQKFTCDPYAPENIHPERRYHVLLIGLKDRYYGARDIMCDYHPIYAGRDAARQAIRNFDPFINQVVIACEVLPRMNPGTAPHVMYRDRQHLLETNLQAELIWGSERDPKVYLFNYQTMESVSSGFKLKIRIVGAWQTNLKTWLPFAFSPRNFGPEFIKFLTDYHRNRGK